LTLLTMKEPIACERGEPGKLSVRDFQFVTLPFESTVDFQSPPNAVPIQRTWRFWTLSSRQAAWIIRPHIWWCWYLAVSGMVPGLIIPFPICVHFVEVAWAEADGESANHASRSEMRMKPSRECERLIELPTCRVVIFFVFTLVEAELLLWPSTSTAGNSARGYTGNAEIF